MRLRIISLVNPLQGWAGSEEMWLLLGKAAIEEGFQVEFDVGNYIANHSEMQPLREKNATIFSRKPLSGLTRRLATKGLYGNFRMRDIDANDAICLSMGCISDLRWTPDLMRVYFKSNRPWTLIVQANAEHFVTSESIREDLRKIFAKAHKVIFVSNANLRLAERQLAWKFPNAIVLPNPIRRRLDKPLPWPEFTDGIIRMAQVARLDVFQKRQDALLEALSQQEIRDLPWRLSFYGDGPDKNHIQNLINFYGLQGKVELSGHVRDFTDIWKCQHIHVFPTAFEGIPLAVIESMFSGRPAIVSSAGGNIELIEHEKEGFVIPGNGFEHISKSLFSAFAIKDTFERLGMNAFEKASTLVPKNLGPTLVNIFRNI